MSERDIALASFIGTVIFGIVSLIALRVSFQSRGYSKKQSEHSGRQTQILENQLRQNDEHSRVYEQFEYLARGLVKFAPGTEVQNPVTKENVCVYEVIFPDWRFRKLIERYVVRTSERGVAFERINPQPHELTAKESRETIERAYREVQAFVQKHPYWGSYFEVA